LRDVEEEENLLRDVEEDEDEDLRGFPVQVLPMFTGVSATAMLVVPNLGGLLMTAVWAVLVVVCRRHLAGGILKWCGAGAGIVVAVVFALMVGPYPDAAASAPRWFQSLLQGFAHLMLLG
jgi:hypothetical protein